MNQTTLCYQQTAKVNIDDVISELLLQLKAGNLRVFSRIYDYYTPILLNFGSRLTNDKELLKDCIHDVFLKFYSKSNELSDIEHFKSYLFISLRNKLCDEHRKRNHFLDISLDDIDLSSFESVESDYLNRESERLTNKKIMFLLEQLSPRQQKAVTLYYIEEKKYQDICDIMNLNYQSVRNLIHRSLIKLRSYESMN